MNGQISDRQKRKPWRNWHVPSRTRIKGGTRLSSFTPSESLEVAEIAARIRYQRY
jgi:hypothetical protein